MDKRWWRYLAIALCVVFLFPLWQYYWIFGLQSGDYFGTAIFIIAFVFFIVEQIKNKPQVGNLVFFYASLIMVVIYGLFQNSLPPLFLALIGTLSLGFVLLSCFPLKEALDRFSYPLLFAVSLPLEGSLQFVLGYPFRSITTVFTALALSPFSVGFRGTTLVFRGNPLEVDAPCSGVSGLWVFVALSLLIALARRYHIGKIIINGVLAVFFSLFYNVFRSVFLFLAMLPTGGVDDWTHNGAGVVSFAVSFALYMLTESAFHRLTQKKTRAKEGIV